MYCCEDDYERIERRINISISECKQKLTHLYIKIYGWNCDGRREERGNKIRIKDNKINMKDLNKINIFIFYEGLNYFEFTTYNKNKKIEYLKKSL